MSDCFDPWRVLSNISYINCFDIHTYDRTALLFPQRTFFHPLLSNLDESIFLQLGRVDVLKRIPFAINTEVWRIIVHNVLKERYPRLRFTMDDIDHEDYKDSFKKKSTDLLYERDYFTMWGLINERTKSQWSFVSKLVLRVLQKLYANSKTRLYRFLVRDELAEGKYRPLVRDNVDDVLLNDPRAFTDPLNTNGDITVETEGFGAMLDAEIDQFNYLNEIFTADTEEAKLRLTLGEIKRKMFRSFLKRCRNEMTPYKNGVSGNVSDLDYERWGEELRNRMYFKEHHRIPLFDNIEDMDSQMLLWMHILLTDDLETDIGTRQDLRWVIYLYMLADAGVEFDIGYALALYYGADWGIGKRFTFQELNKFNSCKAAFYDIIQHATAGASRVDKRYPFTNFDEISKSFFGPSDDPSVRNSNRQSGEENKKDFFASHFVFNIQCITDPVTRIKSLVNYLVLYGAMAVFCNDPFDSQGDSALRSRFINLIFGLITTIENKAPNNFDFKHLNNIDLMQLLVTCHALYLKCDKVMKFGREQAEKDREHAEAHQILKEYAKVVYEQNKVKIHERNLKQYFDLYYSLASAVSVGTLLFTPYGHSLFVEPQPFSDNIFYEIDKINICRPRIMLWVLGIFSGQYLNRVDGIVENFLQTKYREFTRRNNVSSYFETIKYPVRISEAGGNRTETVIDPRYVRLLPSVKELMNDVKVQYGTDHVNTEAAIHRLMNNSQAEFTFIHNGPTVLVTTEGNNTLQQSPDPQTVVLPSMKVLVGGRHGATSTVLVSIGLLSRKGNGAVDASNATFESKILPFILPIDLAGSVRIVLPARIVRLNRTYPKFLSFECYVSKMATSTDEMTIEERIERDMNRSFVTLSDVRRIAANNPAMISFRDLYNTRASYPDSVLADMREPAVLFYTPEEEDFLKYNLNFYSEAFNSYFDATNKGSKYSSFYISLLTSLRVFLKQRADRKTELDKLLKAVRFSRTSVDSLFVTLYQLIKSFKKIRETKITMGIWHEQSVLYRNVLSSIFNNVVNINVEMIRYGTAVVQFCKYVRDTGSHFFDTFCTGMIPYSLPADEVSALNWQFLALHNTAFWKQVTFCMLVNQQLQSIDSEVGERYVEDAVIPDSIANFLRFLEQNDPSKPSHIPVLPSVASIMGMDDDDFNDF